MRRDGLAFIDGSESPRRFSDVTADRPAVEDYVDRETAQRLKVVRPIDDAPDPDQLAAAPPARANVGHPSLKGR